MKNAEIAKILREMGGYYQMQSEPFKPRAYERAADSIEESDREMETIFAEGGAKGLLGISGVGKGIAEHITELLKTGRLKIYEKMKKQIPVNLSELTAVKGLGAKTAQNLYKKYGIKNRRDLERADKKNLLGKKISDALKIKQPKDLRFIFGYQYGLVERLLGTMRASGLFEKIEVGGSFRRRQETIGDLDFLGVARDPKKAMDFFVKLEVARVIEHGLSKSEIRLGSGMQVDLRLVPAESWGAAFIYFTGDLAHNIKMRKIAIEKGLKLSEYGLFKGKKQVAGKTEEELYKYFGMDWIPPEIRTDTGEIELAREHKLPKLLDYGDVRGDLQVQTNWTDGAKSIAEMALAAQKLGREYIAITDHTQTLKITNGLDETRLLKQMAEIDRLNEKFKNSPPPLSSPLKGEEFPSLDGRGKGRVKFQILKGAEVNILKDGTLDIQDKVLAKLDVVGVSIHSHMKMARKDMTARIIRAISNPNVDIFFHPTTRLLQKREPIDFDFAAVLKAAKKYRVAMEINGHPQRTDLRDTMIRQSVEAGVKLTIDSDAHQPAELDYIKYGEGTARRGWAKKSDVLNTKSVDELLKYLKSK